MKPTTSSGRRPLQWSLGPGSILRNRRRGSSALRARGGAPWAGLCPPTAWPLRALRSIRHARYHCQRRLKGFMAWPSLSGGGSLIRLDKQHHIRKCTICDSWTTRSASLPISVKDVQICFEVGDAGVTFSPAFRHSMAFSVAFCKQ